MIMFSLSFFLNALFSFFVAVILLLLFFHLKCFVAERTFMPSGQQALTLTSLTLLPLTLKPSLYFSVYTKMD